jgi:hypothetical protein
VYRLTSVGTTLGFDGGDGDTGRDGSGGDGGFTDCLSVGAVLSRDEELGGGEDG